MIKRGIDFWVEFSINVVFISIVVALLLKSVTLDYSITGYSVLESKYNVNPAVLYAVLVISFVALSMIFRKRVINILEPLFESIMKGKPYVEKQEIIKGLNNLMFGFGFALITVIWLVAVNFLGLDPMGVGFFTAILAIFTLIFIFMMFRNFSKAFSLEMYVEKQRKSGRLKEKRKIFGKEI